MNALLVLTVMFLFCAWIIGGIKLYCDLLDRFKPNNGIKSYLRLAVVTPIFGPFAVIVFIICCSCEVSKHLPKKKFKFGTKEVVDNFVTWVNQGNTNK